MNEADSMSMCPKCQTDMFVDNDGKQMVCPNSACSFLGYDLPQRMPSYSEALKQYQYLLSKCRELVNNEISLNEFQIFISNL